MDWLCFIALNVLLPTLFYLLFKNGRGKTYFKGFFYPIIKKFYASVILQDLIDERDEYLKKVPEKEQECPKDLLSVKESDAHVIYGLDRNGNFILIKMVLKNSLHAEITIEFRVNNGKIYRLPNKNGILTCSLQSRQWKARGLFIQVLEPYKRLRITYNGILRNLSSNKTDDDQLEHVQFNFIWNAASVPFHYPRNFHKDVFVETVSKHSPWKQSDWLKYVSSEYGYEQFGCLTGFIKGSEYPEEITFRLASYRKRRWGFDEATSTREEISNFGVCKNGTLIYFGSRSFNGGEEIPLRYGFMYFSTGESYPMEKINMEKIDADNPSRTTFSMFARKKKLAGAITFNKQSLDNISGLTSLVSAGYFDRDEISVFTILQRGVIKDGDLPKALLMPKATSGSEGILVCRLNSPECLDFSITGGKGNSLGLLSSIESDLFSVPQGFVVTVSALKLQLLSRLELVSSIEHLEKVCQGKSDGNMEEICKSTEESFKNAPICDDLTKIIMEEINRVNSGLSDEEKTWRWAVRSSGIGEDSEELSAAGQNSTFLGCKDEDVLKAVSACWGSLYTYQSVQYRRQHGMTVKSEMGVVVQKTVPAECAGVLFTCHPSTGDPSKMVITSNYGLGESVVSAAADPDTIVISKGYHGDVGIVESNVGKKKIRITLGDDSKGGTYEEETQEEHANKLSIDEGQIVQLGKLGMLLEEEFGNPRDIEWAFFQGKLYLLQSRPVTTLNTWTDFELLHEFDSPIFSDNEIFTRVNIGEVMRGAITPLSHSTILTRMDGLLQSEMTGVKNPYVLMNSPTFLHFGFINILNMIYKMVPPEINVEVRVMELAFLGHPYMDEKVHQETIRRHGLGTWRKKLTTRSQMFHKAFIKRGRLSTAIDINKKFDLKIKNEETPEEFYERITNFFHVFEKQMNCYMNVNLTNTVYNMLCVSILTGGKCDFTPDHYHDIALVLKTDSGVETVELPVILEEIADHIRKSGKSEEFIKKEPEECVKWMEENCVKAARVFEKFLDVHGHRLFSEYELASKPWVEDPTPILEMIQANCRVEAKSKMVEGLSVDETIANLHTPHSKRTKKILKFFIRKLRESIVVKEQTKSQFIRCVGKFREAYKVLSQRLVADGYIPQQDLIYHLTVVELGEVIRKRDPELISKAIKRKRLFQRWNQMHFSDICNGFPVPDRDGTEIFKIERKSGDVVTAKGTPVCTGTIIGRACVIFDLKECVHLQSGDILITYSTDVGWTPYFPMLSGVVTEIGGLLSHGAVVAREYGLPCIVGVQGVTKVFKTGDKVLLDGKTGELQLISES